MKALAREASRRLAVYTLMIFVVWPLLSALATSVEIKKAPYYHIPWLVAAAGSLAGMVLLIPDFLFIGAMALFASMLVFSILAAKNLSRETNGLALSAEPLLLFFSALFGTALYFPGVLSHPAFMPLESLPVWALTALLGGLVILGCSILAKPGFRIVVTVIVAAIGLLAPLPVSLHGFASPSPPRLAPLVLLGLDSVSQDDELTLLRNWSKQTGGVWYTRAVAPGLLTNSVWTSMITMRPVHDHGVFHIFQHFPEKPPGETLIQKARRAGYHTVGAFSDQITSWIGTEGGFDEDRSGPMGWRQVAISHVENASVLLPLFRPLFPKISFSPVVPNHLGTFTFDLDRDFDEIFSMGSANEPVFVAAHSTYLHMPSFPRYADLSWKERLTVIEGPVLSLWDRSFDWEYVDSPADRFRLHEWKVQRLEEAVVRSIIRTKFLSPERRGRLLLFSDHGNRKGLSVKNFWQERYHHVLLVTFGLPARNPDDPISLIDASSLLGLAPSSVHADPVVEFTLAPPEQWTTLVKSASTNWDGSIDLDDDLLATIFRGLRSYRPWPRKTPPEVHAVFSVDK